MEATVLSIYREELPEMEEPDGFVFSGELRLPRPHEWFYSLAKEAINLRVGMRVSTPRLILLPLNATTYYPPVNPHILDKLRASYQSNIPIGNCSRMFNVTKRTVATYYQKFEMDAYRCDQALAKTKSVRK